jgi:hypothetical protein
MRLEGSHILSRRTCLRVAWLTTVRAVARDGSVSSACEQLRVMLRSAGMLVLLTRHRVVALGLIVSAPGCWLVAGAAATASRGESPRGASSMKVVEHVSLKLVKRRGSTKFEHSGRATGTVAGSVRSVTTLSHSVALRGTVTITTKRGKLRLQVDGRARSLELRTRFTGSATIAGGSGRYAHAHGRGTFEGVVNRSTWAATIDAAGSFTF